MRFQYSFIFIIIFSVFFLSCKKKGESDLADSSNLLFQKSEKLIRVYMDSLKNASDSASLYSIIQHFDIKLTNLNYEFPPDTDLMMSEEENDSLIKLYKKWETFKSKQDSIVMKRISNDSIPNGTQDSLKSVQEILSN